MSEIRKYFTSRFRDGYIVEADYSQLEVYVLAWFTRDAQLIYDLTHGVDVHAENAKALFGPAFSPAQRRIAKRLSFQLQYGAGYKSMAATQKIDESIAKKFIKTYYDRYPEVLKWQNKMQAGVLKNRTPSGKHTAQGYPAGTATVVSPTGRRYVFTEEDSPAWMAEPTSFKPTNIKNYPIQGTATGDIVPLMLGKLCRTLQGLSLEERKGILLTNTVHDSVMMDVQHGYLTKAIEIIEEVFGKTSEIVSDTFGIDFDLKLPIEIKIGRSWGEMKKLKS